MLAVEGSNMEWETECTGSATIADCDITGSLECLVMSSNAILTITGEADPSSGACSGDLTGKLGHLGAISIPWTGQVDSSELVGDFQEKVGMAQIEGDFTLERL